MEPQAAVDRRPSTQSNGSRSNTTLSSVLKGRRKSKPNNSSTNSIASSEKSGDTSSGMRSSLDGALDKLRSSKERRNSADSNASNNGKRDKMARLFKGRGRRKSIAQDNGSQIDQTEAIPPLPNSSMFLDSRAYSDESLGLHKSVASSLLTEDSDTES